MLYKILYLSCVIISFSHISLGYPVIELTDQNFHTEIAKHELILVEFFAPWCGHCKKLAPEYLTAATKLQLSTPPVPLANVECVEEGKKICQEQGIKGYPTLKIFRDGEFSADYEGPRNSDGIVSYMEKLAAPSSLFLSSQENLENFIDHPEPSIIGFFNHDDTDSVIIESFVKCSQKLRMDFRFAHAYQSPSLLGQDTILPENIEGEQVWLYQPLRLRSKLDTSAIRIPEGSANEMKEFIERNFMGLAGLREPNNDKYFDIVSRQPQLVFYSRLDWDLNLKTTQYWRNRILKLAKEYKTRINFAISDSTPYREELSKKFGIFLTDEMQVVIVNNGRKYVMQQDNKKKMTAQGLIDFVKDFFDDKIEPYLKSEIKPIENPGPVKVVVGSTFEEIVMAKGKDVMIEFYAPWCGHCKSLEPKYDELGKKLVNNSNVVIAKMDATANDFPKPFKVEGFPTIYWVPANKKNDPIKYAGRREVTDFVDYIQKQATIPFTVLTEESGKDEL